MIFSMKIGTLEPSSRRADSVIPSRNMEENFAMADMDSTTPPTGLRRLLVEPLSATSFL